MKPVEITVTCGTRAEARQIMEALVEDRLAACAQTWPILSCFRWGGEVETDFEHAVLVKSVDTNFEAICEVIRRLHSYELPSIVMIPLEGTGPGYLEWLLDATGGPDRAGRDGAAQP